MGTYQLNPEYLDTVTADRGASRSLPNWVLYPPRLSRRLQRGLPHGKARAAQRGTGTHRDDGTDHRPRDETRIASRPLQTPARPRPAGPTMDKRTRQPASCTHTAPNNR